jgi:ectoine utilization protein EutC
MLPFFTEEDIRAVVAVPDAVRVVREAFRADGLGHTTVPAVIDLSIPGTRGEFHVKTAHVVGMPYVAVKIASGFYDNPVRGLPTGSGLMAMFDASTGMPAGLLLDNGYLTDVRTGAAGAVAAEALARQHIEVVGVIGSGVQARFQVRCLREVRSFKRVVAWSIDPPGLDMYGRELRDQLDLEVTVAAGPEQVVGTADLVVTATPSRAPIVSAAWLRPGLHVTAVGADSPGKQELDPACLTTADLYVCDRVNQCARLGELQHALAAGLIHEKQVHGELGELVAGRKAGRTSDRQITICDLTGVGFQDTAIANLAYERLAAKGRDWRGEAGRVD